MGHTAGTYTHDHMLSCVPPLRLEETFGTVVAQLGGHARATPKTVLELLQAQFPELTLTLQVGRIVCEAQLLAASKVKMYFIPCLHSFPPPNCSISGVTCSGSAPKKCRVLPSWGSRQLRLRCELRRTMQLCQSSRSNCERARGASSSLCRALVRKVICSSPAPGCCRHLLHRHCSQGKSERHPPRFHHCRRQKNRCSRSRSRSGIVVAVQRLSGERSSSIWRGRLCLLHSNACIIIDG